MTTTDPILAEASPVWVAGARLGEGALWDDRAGRLWWVDIQGRRLHRMDEAGGDRRSWDLPQEPGCAALAKDPAALLLGLRSGVFRFAPETGRLDFLAAPEGHRASHRLNDGKIDRSGRFWFGTMHAEELPSEGALYRLEGPGRVLHFDGPYTVPNGPAFSPDGRILYCADSPTGIVHAFEGSARREFLRFREADGHPDGMTVDAEGCLWVCHWGGSRVSRFRTDGQLLGRIELPVENVTSCAFGGADLRTLFITTAGGSGVPGPGLAGSVFAARTAVHGLAAGRAMLAG
ncbi:SMP-30/gluconolactonase/LRE family protein [Belnapia sp. T6]|uniref:SMP-30/gluconolactonase/LRE family protein n=1 Tax=Belnapia mucosa TaxID=2804532 RepID=A0ABS1V1P9_9PROT|nr:SMP-30/gluconolactonase/LRE family protein [Belnapia mucosa]MBL6455600.1 SMP-30/gluconolactonase/LRE family protein [Belnapia mucosa]